MVSVFVIISEMTPVNGTHPASSNIAFFANEDVARGYLHGLWITHGDPDTWLDSNDTVFYADVDPEKYDYIEYRIEEHHIQTGDPA